MVEEEEKGSIATLLFWDTISSLPIPNFSPVIDKYRSFPISTTDTGQARCTLCLPRGQKTEYRFSTISIFWKRFDVPT